MFFKNIFITFTTLPRFFILFYGLILITIIIKFIALYQAYKKEKWFWFVTMLLISSMGILPLIYLGFFNKPDPQNPSIKKTS